MNDRSFIIAATLEERPARHVLSATAVDAAEGEGTPFTHSAHKSAGQRYVMHNLLSQHRPGPRRGDCIAWYNYCVKNTDQKRSFYVRRVENGKAHVAKRCPWCGKLHQVVVPLDDVDMDYVRQLPCGQCDDPAVFGN